MTKRFTKTDYGEGYAVRDSQVNGLPQIRLQYSDEACFLCDWLNKQNERIHKLESDNLKLQIILNNNALAQHDYDDMQNELATYKAKVQEYFTTHKNDLSYRQLQDAKTRLGVII